MLFIIFLFSFSMSSFRRRFMDAIRCRNNTYRRGGGSDSRTSHSFLNSAHHATSFRPRNNNGTYNTCMRSSSKNVHHALPLEYYKSKHNGVVLSHQIKGFHESITNVSEVWDRPKRHCVGSLVCDNALLVEGLNRGVCHPGLGDMEKNWRHL